MADSFTGDILAEILKRLPVKSLLQVRCTKKSWYHLTRSPFFIALHSDYQKNDENKYLLFRDRYRSRFSFRFDDQQCTAIPTLLQLQFPEDMKQCSNISVNIHGTCRGLICFSISAYSPSMQQTYLWNPIIRKAKSLPDSPGSSSHGSCPMLFGLAFGYFSDIDDYKVVKIESVYAEGSRFYTVYVYSLSTNSWTTVPVNNVAQFYSYDELYNSVAANGAAYWIGIKKPVFMQVVVCVNIENETVREILMPPQYADASQSRISSFNLAQRFGEVLLSVVYMDRNTDTFIHDILVLEKDGETNEVWTKKVSIDLNKGGGNWWPVGFRNNGEIVLINYEYDDERGFCSYDHEKEEATEMVDEPDNPGHVWYYADIEDPENPRYDYGYCGPFAYHASEMQPMYVDPFEENLVLLGDTTST